MKTVMMLSLMCLSLSACSKTNILSSVDVKVTEQNQEQFVSLSAKLNLGNAVFDQLQLPIRDPKTGIEIGYLGLQAGAGGQQTVEVGLNASVILHADPGLGATLPNGRVLPAALGVQAGEVMAFPILQYSRVYIGGDLKNNVIIGAALAVKPLDGVSNLAGMAVNIFFGQQINSNLYGLAGLYGSPTANQSGIAVFGKLNLSGAVPAPASPIILGKTSSVVDSLAASISNQAVESGAIDQMNSRSERKVTNFFYGKKRRIQIQ